MNISTPNNLYTPTFNARIKLQNLDNIYNPNNLNNNSISRHTTLDVVFKEGMIVEGLDNFTMAMKNMMYKFFSSPKSTIKKSFCQAQYKLITYTRKLSDRIFLFKNLRGIDSSAKLLEDISNNPENLTKEIAKIGNSIDNKFIVINSENKTLETIAKSKNSTIFVLNHPNYNKDKFIYIILNSILGRLYTSNQNISKYPIPKILVSKNMLNILHPKVAAIYKKLGLSAIDAKIKNKDCGYNAASMIPLLKDFAKNKINIFIFPEGNNSILKNIPLERRIQNGIGNLIKAATNTKDCVTVVPVSIHYTKESNNLGNIYIGKPHYFKKHNNEIIYTDGVEKRKIKHIDYNDSTEAIVKLIGKNLNFGIDKAKDLK